MVATQAVVDVSYGPQALELLRREISPMEVIRRVWETDPDPRPDRWTKHGRQFAVMDKEPAPSERGSLSDATVDPGFGGSA